MTELDTNLAQADTPTYTLQEYPETLAVVRLGAGAEVPEWAESSSIFSVTATAHETSVVCAARSVPTKARHQRGFTAFAVEGPLDFALTGVLLALLFPLAEEEISVFTLSTYDTDWLLIPQNDASRAADAWRSHGHTVNAAVPAKRVKVTKPPAGKSKS
ncbi:MAG: ACT domain-containing protein [Nocardioides sp.]